MSPLPLTARTSSSIEAILGEGIAKLAAAAGVDAGAAWSQKRLPDTPDRAIAITVYRTGRHPTTRLDQYAAQLYGRGRPDDDLDIDELLGPIAEWFAAIEDIDVAIAGGPVVHIDQVRFRSSAPMGIDAANRAERADTFDLDITPPATARRPV